MHRLPRAAGIAVVAVSVASGQGATTNAYRDLGPVTATSDTFFFGIRGVRSLSDGRVLVNDGSARVVRMLDPSLRTSRTVVSSLAAISAIAYGSAGGLYYGLGDSTLFLQTPGGTLTVMDAEGRAIRQMALPSGASADVVRNASSGVAAVSSRYGFVHSRIFRALPPAAPIAGTSTAPAPDSVIVAGYRGESEPLDTIGRIYWRTTGYYRFDVGPKLVGWQPPFNPFAVPDQWAVASNGAVAILHAREYRVEWVSVDGSRRMSPQLFSPWARITDQQRARLADSLNAAHRAQIHRNWQLYSAQMRLDSAQAIAARLRMDHVFTPDEFPEWPVFPRTAPAILADRDGNVWVNVLRGDPSAALESTFDVVDQSGQIIDRVRIPPGRSVAGFGPRGVVYLIAQNRARQFLERATRR